MSYDVAIVGLGTAGAAAAAFCARRGLSVLGVDARPRDRAGASWVNGVPEWVFGATDLALPEGPERRGGEHPFHLIVGYNPSRRVRIEHTGVLEVDMRYLVARLWADAERHGAHLRDGVRAISFDGQTLATSDGPVQARWYVDAAGIGGFSSLGVRVPKTSLCTAAQHVHEVRDRGAAQAFLHEFGAREGAALCFTGVAGGYSILNVRVEGDEVSVLTGSIPGWGNLSGRQIARDFGRRYRFVGPAKFGGARAIPLAVPPARVAEGSVAAIGDAAGQVHSVHGSGIAQQLLAAQVLAEAFHRGEGPRGYNLRWQRTYAGYLAWSILFQRFSQSLELRELDRLVETGAMHAGVMGQVLKQRPPRPRPRAAAKSLLGLARSPGLRARLIGIVGRQPLVAAHYARYPEREDELEAWLRTRKRLVG